MKFLRRLLVLFVNRPNNKQIRPEMNAKLQVMHRINKWRLAKGYWLMAVG